MHRDAKLGLALGILVIGFAAAFCFPRHIDPVPPSPSSASAEIDQQLLARSVKVYTEATNKTGTLASSPPVGGLLTATKPEMSPIGASAPQEAQVRSIAPIPEPDDKYDSVEEDELVPDEAEVPAEPETYTVLPGDTLSSIALRRLGGSGKYSLIFEANRDQLGSADDLQVGMVLRIPGPPKSPQLANTPRSQDRRAPAGSQTAPTPRPAPLRMAELSESGRSSSDSATISDAPRSIRVPLPTNAIGAPSANRQTVPNGSALRGAASVGSSLRKKR